LRPPPNVRLGGGIEGAGNVAEVLESCSRPFFGPTRWWPRRGEGGGRWSGCAWSKDWIKRGWELGLGCKVYSVCNSFQDFGRVLVEHAMVLWWGEDRMSETDGEAS